MPKIIISLSSTVDHAAKALKRKENLRHHLNGAKHSKFSAKVAKNTAKKQHASGNHEDAKESEGRAAYHLRQAKQHAKAVELARSKGIKKSTEKDYTSK